MEQKRPDVRNRWFYGLGTVGRDFYYTLVSMYLMFYLTDILLLDKQTLWYVTGAMILTRVFDAFNDPFMGIIVDNTRTRFGRFKPWLVIGAVLSCVFYLLLFVDYGVRGLPFAAIFFLVYVLWEISYTANDIAYWSMIPALTQDQSEREKMGSIARICANIGMFAMVVGIMPITKALGANAGSMTKGYFHLALIAMSAMLLSQSLTLWVSESPISSRRSEKTSVRELFSLIVKNDQLMWTTVSLGLFMIGYITTTSFGQYYFKYVAGDEDQYAVFALVLGVSQITALAVFPLVRKVLDRRRVYGLSMILVISGYVLFFLASGKVILTIAVAGVLIFVGQAWIQLMMLMFISDCVEYGEWKFGRRNNSITLSLQPFIYKMGAALASGIVGATVIFSGMREAQGAQEMTASGRLFFKIMMMLFPLLLIVLSYLIYRRFYRIDEAFYRQIVAETAARRETDG